jgi:LysM repeat protein
MIQVSTPGADGKVIHTVQAYQTLSTIAKAYGISVEKILALNNLQLDWPLQIGQKLLIDPGRVTPSPTPRPLSPIQKLTPSSDGKYYHTVQSGESLSWIASLYTIQVNELMGWNGLDGATVLQPGQKLVLQVTPPATPTYTPGPATATPTATPVTPTATPTQTLTQAPTSTPVQVEQASAIPGGPWVWVALLGIGGAVVAGLVFRKNIVK